MGKTSTLSAASAATKRMSAATAAKNLFITTGSAINFLTAAYSPAE
jgi:hypothetical protein